MLEYILDMSVDINQASVYNNTQLWSSFEHYVKYHQVCFLVEPLIHLAKLVRPLTVLSFNSPKSTKGLDALTHLDPFLYLFDDYI